MPSSGSISGKSLTGGLFIMKDLSLVQINKASSFADYLYLRRLRNLNCHNLTNDNSEITLLRQFKFYLNRPPNISIYLVRLSGKRVGYGLINQVDGNNFVTEVIEEEYRNLGLATRLILFLTAEFGSLRAVILSSNHTSIQFHRKNNFFLIENDGQFTHMELSSR